MQRAALRGADLIRRLTAFRRCGPGTGPGLSMVYGPMKQHNAYAEPAPKLKLPRLITRAAHERMHPRGCARSERRASGPETPA
jgi:hypothetical protein